MLHRHKLAPCVAGLIVLASSFLVQSGEVCAQDVASRVVATGPNGAATVSTLDVETYVLGKNLSLPETAGRAQLNQTNAKRVVEQVLRVKLLSAKARDLQLVSADEESAISSYAANSLLMERYIDFEVEKRLMGIDWPMIANEYYRTHLDEFTKGEQVRVRHILIKPDNGWQDAIERAIHVRERLLSGEDADNLARQLSEDKSAKSNGGDLGFFPRGRMFPTFDDAAFKLKPGEISDLVVTSFGVHVIVGIDRKPAEPIPFDQVKERLITSLKQKRWVDEERAMLQEALWDADGYAVQIDEQALQRLIDEAS